MATNMTAADALGFIKNKGTNAIQSPIKNTVKSSPISGVGTSMGFGANKTVSSLQTKNLKDLPGLEKSVADAGLAEKYKGVIADRGEDPKTIFSGGMVSDFFDVLNAFQYGVAGVLKGKGFVEGIKTRQSFSDQDALGKYGTTGLISGIALDIATDPLTYLGGLGILTKISKAVKGAKAVQKTASAIGKSKVGDWLGTKLIYRFGQDPVYKKMAERMTNAMGSGIANILEISRPLTKLNNADQKLIATYRKSGKLSELPQDLLQRAEPVFAELDKLGKEAVQYGLLDADTYAQNVGKYIARMYTKFEIPEAKKVLGYIADKKPQRIDITRFMKRKDIPEEIRKAWGEIEEAGYPTIKAMMQLKQSVEHAKFFDDVARNFGKDVVEDGLKQLPETKRLGKLSGKYVPEKIFNDLQEVIRVKSDSEKILNKVVGGFKFGKVILNPATHARNVLSNMILNNFEGLSPARLDIYVKAANEIKNKGRLYQEARSAGLGVDTFAAQEIGELLKGTSISKKVIQGLSNIYQGEEEWAKMAQYIYQRGKGLNPEEAMKIAEKATFNYAQVTPFIRRLRESIFGFPFITFTYKATPQVLKTAVQNPQRISWISKTKQAIENQSNLEELKAERAVEPQWIKDGFYIKLPIKDEQGRSAYFDLTYILPFGDLVSGQMIDRNINQETGLPESVAQAGLRKAPTTNLIYELSKNKDFYNNKIWKDSDTMEKQLGDIMRHVMKTYAPPLVSDQIPGGYKTDGTRRQSIWQKVMTQNGIDVTPEMQQRNLEQAISSMFGVKITPFDLEQQTYYSELDRQKAIQTILQEEGLIKSFNINYVPKNKKTK